MPKIADGVDGGRAAAVGVGGVVEMKKVGAEAMDKP